MKLIKRNSFKSLIEKAFRSHKVVAILGPRQCGKTTLARMFLKESKWKGKIHYFDLEDPTDLGILENPKMALEPLKGMVVIDEIQRIPDLFTVLRVLVDQPRSGKKFLILGSASRDLLRQSSETLAGRIAYLELTPFQLGEVKELDKLWVRGGFPNSYLSKREEDSFYWRKQYAATFLERDIPSLGIKIPPQTLRRFWAMLAHYHGQTFNASEIGRSLGLGDTTARRYLDILTSTFMVRQLTPWIANYKKRQVKMPKIYFRDSGLFHLLMDIADLSSLRRHPKLGASWEGFALEQIVCSYQVEPHECFFWGVHGQAELDLLIVKDGKKRGFEFKYSDSPSITKSMQQAIEILELDSLHIIYPGSKSYQIGKNMQVESLSNFI